MQIAPSNKNYNFDVSNINKTENEWMVFFRAINRVQLIM